MGLGLLIAGIIVLFIGIGLAAFAWWAGSTTGAAVYNDLNCGSFYGRTGTEQQCSAASGGMIVGLLVGVVAWIFIIVGFLMSLIFGIKLAVDYAEKPKTTLK